MVRIWALALLIAACPGLAQQKARKRPGPAAKEQPGPARWPIASLGVEGLHTYSREQVLAVAGLKVGQAAGKEEFEAARDRLVATGAFETVGYKFAPAQGSAGYAASFQVTEAEPLYPVTYENLGVSAAELNNWLRARDPLFGPRVAATTVVLERYARAIEELLAAKERPEKLIGAVASGKAGEFHIVFRSAAPRPVVAEVRFEGNQQVPGKALLPVISGVAYGAPYTEEGFRELLESAVRPLYEARGLLRVVFTRITTEQAPDVKGLVVRVAIEEGPVFNLGKVRVAPNAALGGNLDVLLKAAKLKPDEPANFEDIGAAAGRITRMVRRKGYLHAEGSVERVLNDGLKTVDLTITIREGPQYWFGKLTLEGLDLHGEAAVKKLWGLKEGKPFDAEYPDYFLARVREDGVFDNLGKTKSIIRVDEVNHVVDVTLQFR